MSSRKLLPIVDDWTCRREGDCCRTGRVRMTVEEYKLIEARRPSVDMHAMGVFDQGRVWVEIDGTPCPLLAESGDCSVYDVRPYQCRRFQCHRPEGEAFDPSGPLGCKNLSDRLEQSAVTRKAYKQNQAKAQKWANRHGWTGREV